MSTNQYGTANEARRAECGFVAPRDRSAEEKKERSCGTCALRRLITYTNRDGGVGVSVRCVHVLNGFSTREKAVCKLWERKL